MAKNVLPVAAWLLRPVVFPILSVLFQTFACLATVLPAVEQPANVLLTKLVLTMAVKMLVNWPLVLPIRVVCPLVINHTVFACLASKEMLGILVHQSEQVAWQTSNAHQDKFAFKTFACLVAVKTHTVRKTNDVNPANAFMFVTTNRVVLVLSVKSNVTRQFVRVLTIGKAIRTFIAHSKIKHHRFLRQQNYRNCAQTSRRNQLE
jgi:hypothetical protein